MEYDIGIRLDELNHRINELNQKVDALINALTNTQTPEFEDIEEEKTNDKIKRKPIEQ